MSFKFWNCAKLRQYLTLSGSLLFQPETTNARSDRPAGVFVVEEFCRFTLASIEDEERAAETVMSKTKKFN